MTQLTMLQDLGRQGVDSHDGGITADRVIAYETGTKAFGGIFMPQTGEKPGVEVVRSNG